MAHSIKAVVGKPLNNLKFRREERLIVAGTFLSDGRMVFVDRINSELLITSMNGVDVLSRDVSMKTRQNKPAQPSDVNLGFTDSQLLVTFTGGQQSVIVVYDLDDHDNLVVNFKRDLGFRTRTVAVLNNEHFVASEENQVFVLDIKAHVLAKYPRHTRDRGGLVMSPRHTNRLFFGDGNDFVSCQYQDGMITEIFRFSHAQMTMPRGSAFTGNGDIVIGCEAPAKALFRISATGSFISTLLPSAYGGYGDVDFNPDGVHFFTTFWDKNVWPVLHHL